MNACQDAIFITYKIGIVIEKLFHLDSRKNVNISCHYVIILTKMDSVRHRSGVHKIFKTSYTNFSAQNWIILVRINIFKQITEENEVLFRI